MLKILALTAAATFADILQLDGDYTPKEALSQHNRSILAFYEEVDEWDAQMTRIFTLAHEIFQQTLEKSKAKEDFLGNMPPKRNVVWAKVDVGKYPHLFIKKNPETPIRTPQQLFTSSGMMKYINFNMYKGESEEEAANRFSDIILKLSEPALGSVSCQEIEKWRAESKRFLVYFGTVESVNKGSMTHLSKNAIYDRLMFDGSAVPFYVNSSS